MISQTTFAVLGILIVGAAYALGRFHRGAPTVPPRPRMIYNPRPAGPVHRPRGTPPPSGSGGLLDFGGAHCVPPRRPVCAAPEKPPEES